MAVIALIATFLMFNTECISRALDPSREELKFERAFAKGMLREKARAALKSKQIEFQETYYPVAGTVHLLPGNQPVNIQPGERVVSIESSIVMGCWDMKPVLLFGRDDRLSKVYFSGWPNCP